MAFRYTRFAWALLMLTALGLELAAVAFQYLLGLDPCVMCVYERLAVIGLIGAGLLGLINPRQSFLRILGYLVWAVSAGWGLALALEHVYLQRNPEAAMGCSFLPEFPDWMPLHEWIPTLFLPTGYCDDIQWQWLSLSMPEWMVVVFGTYLVVLGIVLVTEVRGLRGSAA
ncbi:disulfide bond formation protein DsbB [Thiosocius teredinicola]|uniref:disulfide bond formation protein DsbB n=1 Tax=Thiosocius teredinicola TaxID=1973002 RepID=UPI002FE4796C